MVWYDSVEVEVENKKNKDSLSFPCNHVNR